MAISNATQAATPFRPGAKPAAPVAAARDAVAKFAALPEGDTKASAELARTMVIRLGALGAALPAGTLRTTLQGMREVFEAVAAGQPTRVAPQRLRPQLDALIHALAAAAPEHQGRERAVLLDALRAVATHANMAVARRQPPKPRAKPTPAPQAPRPAFAPLPAATLPAPAAKPLAPLTAPVSAVAPTAAAVGAGGPDAAAQMSNLVNGCVGGILGIAVFSPVLTIAGPLVAAAAGIGMVAAAIKVLPKWF